MRIRLRANRIETNSCLVACLCCRWMHKLQRLHIGDDCGCFLCCNRSCRCLQADQIDQYCWKDGATRFVFHAAGDGDSMLYKSTAYGKSGFGLRLLGCVERPLFVACLPQLAQLTIFYVVEYALLLLDEGLAACVRAGCFFSWASMHDGI